MVYIKKNTPKKIIERYKKVLNLVKEGVPIYKACLFLGFDTAYLYSSISFKQKRKLLELRLLASPRNEIISLQGDPSKRWTPYHKKK